MNKYIIFLLICLFVMGCSDNNPEQIEEISVSEIGTCGTPAPPPPAWFFESDTRGLNNEKYYNLNVFVHVVRTSYGYGFNKETVSSTIISNLNRDYLNTNFSFSLLGSEYIDDDNFNNLPSALINPLCVNYWY